MPESPISPVGTFMNVPTPSVPGDPGDARAVILGLPFDCGTDPNRSGARLGPRSIREQSLLLSAFDSHTGINPLDELAVVDFGDARVHHADMLASLPWMEAAVSAAVSRGALSIALGGDGSIALAEMRALHARYGSLAVVHFDAHTDAYPIEGYNNATPFARAHDEELVATAQSFHIGYRRSNSYPGVVNYGRQLGYSVVSMDEFIESGIVETMARVRAVVGLAPVYLCFDMDFFDPSVAPGVCNPAWGGATAREGLRALRECAGLNVCGVSINTITPTHDPGGMSAMLAATVAYEVLLMQAIGTIATPEYGRRVLPPND